VDTILKLKEYCHILSNIPQDQQNLLYNGKILLNEKLINDYNIENNNNITLEKKEESKPENILLKQKFPDNINKVIINLSSLFNTMDMDKVANFFQVLELGNFSDFGFEP